MVRFLALTSQRRCFSDQPCFARKLKITQLRVFFFMQNLMLHVHAHFAQSRDVESDSDGDWPPPSRIDRCVLCTCRHVCDRLSKMNA